MAGIDITVLSVRVALVLYLTALLSQLSLGLRGEKASRLLWTGGLIAYSVHVVAAFHWVHGWSHERAWVETARQTEEMFGVATGAGLWFNHLFTLVWTFDVLWWWLAPASRRRRSAALSVALHGFLAFMFFNGAVVFASGFSRWVGIAGMALLALIVATKARARRRASLGA